MRPTACVALPAEDHPGPAPVYHQEFEVEVSILHVLVLDHLLSDGRSQPPRCRYVHLLREVAEAFAAGECDLAALVPPARMSHVEQIAGGLEKMPPKSTYFYPKLLSGLVFNPLKGH